MTAWLDRAARLWPEAPALIDAHVRLNYRALAAQASRHAAVLSSLGVSAGDRVALEAPVSTTTVVWLHAVLWLGATVIPISPARPRGDDAMSLDRLDPRAFVASSIESASKTPRPPARPDDCILIDAGLAIDTDVEPIEPAAHDPARTATIMLTSGSSAAPKAVPLTLGNHAASAAAIANRIGTAPADRWLLCLPLEHIGGLAILLRSVLSGTAVVLMPRFDAREFVTRIREQRVTLTSMVPGMLDAIMQDGEDRAPATLRAVFVGGAPAPPALLARARSAGWPVIPTWGMTEACSQLATPSPAAAAGMEFADGHRIAMPPLSGVEIRTGPSGALQVRGPMLFTGYLENPAADPDEQGWFTTGDHGIVDADGSVRILGRVDKVIISGGINVHLDAVTQRLLECPLIEDAATLGMASERWGQRVVAAVVPRDSKSRTDRLIEALDAWSRRHLAPAERPLHWRIVERIPRSAAGKPLSPALKALFE